ncbi:3784_t:CDS:2, partial [Funneliformis mosseae]
MSAHWDVYFDETSPKEYRLLSFYQHRQQQEDFTFSFQKEASRLRKSLDLLVKEVYSDRQYERLPVVPRRGKTHTTTYGRLSVVPRRGKTHTTTVGILRVAHLMVLRNHRSKNTEIDRLWNEVERESLEIEHAKEKKQLQLDQLKIARVMTKGTEHGVGNIMENVNMELVESATYLKRRRDVDYKEDRDGYTTPCPKSSMVNNPEDEPKPKRRAKTDD